MEVNMDPIIMQGIPKKFNLAEFEKVLDQLDNKKEIDHFRNCYKRDRGNKYHILDENLSESDLGYLWEIYFELNINELKKIPNIEAISHYIYKHRIKCRRIGDSFDDYCKAIYLTQLLKYFEMKRTRVILLRDDDEMEEMINMVNNIFDRAYFLKKDYPERSDLMCFTEAEREFCEEKMLNHLAFLEYKKRIDNNLPGDEKKDYENAKRIFWKQEIEKIAYYNYEERIRNNLPPDSLADYINAENKYWEWKIIKRIATLCWNRSSDKNRSLTYYWFLAENVVERLKNEKNYNDIRENLYKGGFVLEAIKKEIHQ